MAREYHRRTRAKPLAPRPRASFLIELDPPFVRIVGADFTELDRLEPLARRLEIVLRSMLARERAA